MRKFSREIQFAILIVFALLQTTGAQAAPCCGGSVSVPALITGFEKARVSVGLSQRRYIADVPADDIPVFRASKDQRSVWRQNFAASYHATPEWQFGFQNSGDTVFAATTNFHERESDMEPGFFASGLLSVPTGRSVESTLQMEDATGVGYWSAGLGLTYQQVWKRYDFFASGTILQGFNAKVEDVEIRPSTATELEFGSGMMASLGWRVGASVKFQHTGARQTFANEILSQSVEGYLWPFTIQVSRFLDMKSSFTAAYRDETLIGPTRNTALARSITVLYSYRYWE